MSRMVDVGAIIVHLDGDEEMIVESESPSRSSSIRFMKGLEPAVWLFFSGTNAHKVETIDALIANLVHLRSQLLRAASEGESE